MQLKLFNNPKTRKFSYSQLRTYLICPYKYKLIYQDKLRVKLKPGYIQGIQIHNVVYHYSKSLSKGQDVSLGSLIDIYTNSKGYDGLTDEMKTSGKEIINNFYQSGKTSAATTLFLEKQFMITINNDQFTGIIDRADLYADSTLELIDYKSAGYYEDFTFFNTLQLYLYSLGIQKLTGRYPDLLTIYYLEPDRKISRAFSADKLEDVQTVIMKITSLIQTGVFEKNIGDHCPGCEFYQLCLGQDIC